MVAEKQTSYEDIYAYMCSFYKMSIQSFDLIFNCSVFKALPAGTILDDSGDIPDKIYLIVKGVMRSYVRLESGKEVTKSLFTPMTIIASFEALLNKTPSGSTYECLTDSEIYVLDFTKFKELYKSNIEILGFYAKFLEALVCEKDKKYIEVLTMNATERYLNLRKIIPNIDNLIPQYQIAKFLSITPVQLSRVRGKL